MPEMQKMGDKEREIKSPVNYTDFEKMSHRIEYGLQGFIDKNIEGESTEENDLSHILWTWVCCIKNFKCY